MWSFIVSLGPWAWIILAAILFALELVVPGAFMMWLGLASLLVGVLSFLVDWSWEWQGIAFALSAIASIPLWRRFARRIEPPQAPPFLNRRTEALIGQTFTLDKPIVDGVGAIHVYDTVWRVNGNRDCPAGSRVRVVRVDGANLVVEPAE
ncbi:MAG: NfeD family protein [Pseudorhodoplanes sp.]|nr:Inner membrane protein YbbJ [Pseudorhodoplanes sp.]MBW7947944.1 NfeD family protein [Pseudorhodoplanes sp.]MCL4712425.1 NfeD family protein [Pseudorhodoplanes sp.]MCQ3942334.1 NfeD family protein [Alphaproteobacteria bacterium]GIK81720.1 MAG: membrane protein [Alphaproteobacteria bacterium]